MPRTLQSYHRERQPVTYVHDVCAQCTASCFAGAFTTSFISVVLELDAALSDHFLEALIA